MYRVRGALHRVLYIIIFTNLVHSNMSNIYLFIIRIYQ